MDWEETLALAGRGRRARSQGQGQADHTAFTDRMLEVLRKSPVLHLGGGKTVTLHNIRPPAKTLSLSAEALVDATAAGQSPSIMDAVDEAEEQSGLKLPLSRKPVAIVFGPENGAVSERLVFEAAREAQRQELHAPLRHRLRHPAQRARADRKLRRRGRRAGDLRPGHARPDDGRPAQEHALQPDLQRVRPAGGRVHIKRAGRDVRRNVATPWNCWAWTCSTRRRWRSIIARATTCRRGSWTPTTTASASTSARRSSRAPRLGQPQAGAQGHVRGQRVGAPGRHGQRAVRGGRASADRGQGDRRPRQRAAGGEGRSRRRGHDRLRSPQPHPQLALREPAWHWVLEQGVPAEQRAGRRDGGLLLP